MGHCCGTLLWDSLPAPQILRVLKLYYKVASSQLPAPQTLHVLQLYYKVASSQLPAPPDKSHSRLHFAHSTRTISPEGCARMGQIALSPAFRALDTHDLRRGLRAHGTIALSPAFRALDTHDLRRGLRAHGTNRTLACIWCTRHARSPQRVARQVSKTSASYETSSKTHSSKSAKRAFRTRLPPKVKRKHPSEHTHHAALPSSFAIPAPPNNVRSHANPNGTATFTSTTTHTLTIPCACHESFRVHASDAHKVLRLPRHVTSVTSRNLMIPCACHENRTSAPQSPHKVLRLPRKGTISSHVSFNKICTTPHVWNDFDPCTLPSTKIAISAESCHENSASMPHPVTQIPMARPHPTPQKHGSPNANPNGTAQQSADLTKRCACPAKRITFLARHVLVQQITME